MSEQKSRQFPSTYHTFERTIEGRPRTFWIQDLTDDHTKLAVDYFCKYFMRDEPLSQCLGYLKDDECVEEFKTLLVKIISQKSSLACFTKLDNGNEKLVALNFCRKVTKSDVKFNARSKPFVSLLEIVEYINSLKDIYEFFGVNEYLRGVGLVTIPEYRGYKIGLELLNARRFLAKAMGLKVTLTLFTAQASQKLAEQAGYQDLVPITFEELEEHDPPLINPSIRNFTNCLRYMYIVYES